MFYNTNVLNEYRTADEAAVLQAEYERRYAQYADIAQPFVTTASLRVDIHPSERRVEVRGSYELVNHGSVAIDSIHVATAPAVETRALTFDRAAESVLCDRELGHSIYALETPLESGDSMRLDFEVRYEARGFGESGTEDMVVANGTFFTNAWFPAIGYQRERELILPSRRRELGLPERPVVPRLEDAPSLVMNRAPGTMLDVVISTAEGQTGVASGALRRSWDEDGRSFFHYTTDAPIGDEWAFASARYAVHEAKWQDVAIRIVHHPEHTRHVEPVVRSLQASFEYYTRELGPYPYRHVTVLEVPGDGVGMHAEASMITHGEGITLMNPKGRQGLDMQYYVAAHEIGHQWNVPAALIEGAPVLSESMATYFAMKLVEHSRGHDQFWRLTRFLRLPYPIAPIRRGEPLLRALDPYMSYRWGPFALNALSVYVGEDRVNAAIRRLLDTHRPADAPLATTLDLLHELRAVTPDSLQYLLHDLFEVNTYWRFSTERVTVDSLSDGQWRVTMDVRARKMVHDSTGMQVEVPMDEWVPVGVFARPEPGRTILSKPLYLEMHRIRSGDQTITIDVPERPLTAGIDPFHVLDWEELEEDDNREWIRQP